MFQKTLKTTNGRLTVSIPTLLNEVTLGQMMQLQQHENLSDLQAISILSNTPAEQLQHISNPHDLLLFADHVLSLSQQITQLYNSDTVPKKITFFMERPVTITVLNNLSVEPAGAFMAAREIIADEIKQYIALHGDDDLEQHFNPSINACCQVLAHYFFCRVTGKPYNEYEAVEFCAEIKKLRVTEALPVAKHFFTCYPNLLPQRTSCWHRLQQFWNKKLVSKPLGSLAISIP